MVSYSFIFWKGENVMDFAKPIYEENVKSWVK